MKLIVPILCSIFLFSAVKSKKKDIRDYNDADLERLFEEWEKDEEPLPVDELPEWDPRKPQPQIDLNKMKDFKDPEEFLKISKKGKSLMIFVKVSGNPTRTETEELTSLWQTGLWNNHVQVDRFLLEDNRAIFMFKDGSVAWDAKDYLIQQERCEEVTIEQKTYPGINSSKRSKDSSKEEKKKEKKKKEKSKKKREKTEL